MILRVTINMTEEVLNKIIGNNVKRYRIEGCYKSEEDFAKIVGTSRSNIAHLESRNINQGISLYLLYKIAKALDKKMSDFFI